VYTSGIGLLANSSKDAGDGLGAMQGSFFFNLKQKFVFNQLNFTLILSKSVKESINT
jgi:hypothetical protein